jgi:hypothetical protein
MKRTILSLALLLFMLAVPPALPASGQEGATGRATTAPEQENYEKSMKERLGKLGAQLDALKREADVKAGQVEARLKADLAEAEQKRQEAARKLEELGRASKDSWEKFSAEAERAAQDFEQAFERAVKRRE